MNYFIFFYINNVAILIINLLSSHGRIYFLYEFI